MGRRLGQTTRKANNLKIQVLKRKQRMSIEDTETTKKKGKQVYTIINVQLHKNITVTIL